MVGGDAVVETFQFGDMLEEVVEIKVFECAGLRIFYHTNGATGINQQYGWIVVFHKHNRSLIVLGAKIVKK